MLPTLSIDQQYSNTVLAEYSLSKIEDAQINYIQNREL